MAKLTHPSYLQGSFDRVRRASVVTTDHSFYLGRLQDTWAGTMNSYSNYNPYSTTSYGSNGPANGGGFYGGAAADVSAASGGGFGSPGSASKVPRLAHALTLSLSPLISSKGSALLTLF
jgi:hypothetical protein